MTVARVTFAVGGRPAAAVLDAAAGWSCPDPVLAGALNDRLAAADRSPAAGTPLRRHALEMAGVLGGTAGFPGTGPPTPGVIY